MEVRPDGSFENCVTEVAFVSRKQVARELGVSLRHLSNYVSVLLEACPDEFDYEEGSRAFDSEQYQALQKVRQLFTAGLLKRQVIDRLKIGGI